jgi:CubicO group peptidase (beta-lactamase class C family)
MRRPLLALTIALSIYMCVPAHAQELVYGRLRDYLEALRTQAGIPGMAAAVVGNVDVVWEQAFGKQDLEQSLTTLPSTPFQLDGLTQVFTASIVLRCVEEGRLSLDDSIGQYTKDSPDGNATIRQILTHTSGAPSNLAYAYRPERLDSLTFAVRACTGDSFRETIANWLKGRLGMFDSVPGLDILTVVPPAEGVPSPTDAARYASILQNLAVPYSVDQQRRAAPSHYNVTTVAPAAGLISTVRDMSQFYLALRNGDIVRPETLAVAWQPPVGPNGQRLPHGLGWFVQSYNGTPVVWQFGLSENASSSLAVTIPARGLTMILVANSDGLARPFQLSAGDVSASPFARVFLNLFTR